MLDTNTPMPHILQVATASASVTFPNTTHQVSHNHQTYPVTIQEEDCSLQNVCERDWFTGQETCTLKWVCTPVNRTYYDHVCGQSTTYNALNWEQTNNLLTVVNGIQADFVQVRVEASRSVAGGDNNYGTFVAVLPPGQFLSQGSTLLESAFIPGGASWLRRIMSVYVEGGVVKVKFKHSNRGKSNHGAHFINYPRSASFLFPFCGDAVGVTNISSKFDFTFYISVGKFT